VTAGRLHAITWALWALAAALTVQLAPNPVYVAAIIGIAFLAVETHHLEGPTARAFPVLVGIAVAFALIRVVLTALTTHGVGDVLVTLPEATLPTILGGFTVGGTIEAPVVALAAAEGLAVVGVIAAFAAFNAVASHHELLQSAPRAFHEPGLVVTVALAFVPATLTAIEAAREADLARTGGVVVRRGRVTRLTIPVVETGLERAVALAESMDARGFARGGATASDRVAGWLGLAGMLALAGSFVALVGRANEMAILLSVVGIAALAGAIAAASAGPRPTRYRPRRPARLDVAVMAIVVLCPVGVSVLAIQGHASLRWATSPMSFPAVSPLVVGLILLLAAPCAVSRKAATVTQAAPEVALEQRTAAVR
jgi:energy-coupling factor transport system permease protein